MAVAVGGGVDVAGGVRRRARAWPSRTGIEVAVGAGVGAVVDTGVGDSALEHASSTRTAKAMNSSSFKVLLTP